MTWMNRAYDVAIIGGGINGAAIARDATLRGLQVILLEKHDFACGASSKNSKLIHGGVRYLENFQFRLIKESLKERSILLSTAPNLVKPLPFVVPVYQGSVHPLWLLKLGLHLYDFLSPEDLPKHTNLNADQISALFPSLKKNHLQGGCLYYDAGMLDNRLVIENILDAETHGAVVMNYTHVTGFTSKEGALSGIRFQSLKDGLEGEIGARTIVNATGAWSNQFLLKDGDGPSIEAYPTKGVHLVLPPIQHTHALLLTAPQDGRVFFLIPWNGYNLLGTTDTPFEGNPDNVSVEKEDIDYLMSAFTAYFPDSGFSAASVLASFAGLRPLVKNHVRAPSNMSRDYTLDIASSGLITLLGGKYTTYRHMAEKVVDTVIKQLHSSQTFLSCQTQSLPLCKFALPSHNALAFARDLQIDLEQVHRLVQHYGLASLNILARIKETPQEGGQICPEHPHLWAEVSHAILNEKAMTLEDWFERRTSIAYTACGGKKCAAAVAQKFADALGWDETQMNRELETWLSKT